MYLDQHGNVRACCMNDRHLLGNVTEASLAALWHGEGAQRLRRAMEADDLSVGCDFCGDHVDRGRPDLAYSQWFDAFAFEGPEPAWPKQLELSLTNTCNLRCVMCNGEWSSSIRSQVEHRPPLAAVYDDAFFEGLRPFLPHLERIKFYGGEPFLASETLRVMDLLVEEGLTTRCHATTNGTQWTPRVERILSMLPVDVAISLDAATQETYEAIRRGSSWVQVRRNLDRFLEWSHRRETWVSLTFCLMTVNWHEFGDFCRMADELGVDATVNAVSQPDHLSLYRASVAELTEVVERLTAQDAEMCSTLGQNRQIWTDELDKLRRHLGDERARLERRPDEAVPVRVDVGTRVTAPGVVRTAPDTRDQETAAAIESARAEYLDGGAHRVELDAGGQIRWVEPGGVLTIAPEALLGRHHEEIRGVVSATLGDVVDVVNRQLGRGAEESTVHLADGRVLDVLSLPIRADGRRDDGVTLHFRWAGPAGADRGEPDRAGAEPT